MANGIVNMARAPIVLDQVLHGYQNGHSLLESSRKLSPESERIMLTMSDMSGPTMVPGFEDYITGYPLPELGCYALARTWLASDMKRPGSVWTHTLLLKESDLHEVRQADALTRLFRRPRSGALFQAYAEKLHVNSEDGSNEYFDSLPLIAFENIFRAVYQYPDKPIYVLAENGTEFEKTLLRIWSGQWPKLRMNFSFCSGSIADRKLKNRPLDLQVLPKRNLSFLRQEVTQGRVLENPQLPAPNVAMDVSWFAVTSAQYDNRFEVFVDEIQGDIAPRRDAFVSVIKAFKAFEKSRCADDSGSAEAVVEELAGVFPSVSEGASLKRALLKSPLHLVHMGFQVLEEQLVKSLCLTKKADAFDAQALEIASRAKQLWESEHSSALQLTDILIGNTRLNPMGEAFLEGVCDAITPAEVAQISAKRQLAVETFVRRRPELATHTAIWQCASDTQRGIFQALVRSEADEDILQRAIDAVITGSASAAVNEFETAGQRILTALLSWLSKNQLPRDRSLGDPIKRILRNHAKETLEWLRTLRTKNAMAVVSQSLEPQSKDVLAIPTESWLLLAGGPGPSSELPDATVCAFLLAIGLRASDSKTPDLLVYSFQCVHDAAASQTLPFESWRSFEDIAPPISMWRVWDHCERLRAALLDTFMTHGWPVGLLLKSITNPQTLHDLVRLADTARTRKKYLRAIASQMAHGSITATADQWAAFQYLR